MKTFIQFIESFEWVGQNRLHKDSPHHMLAGFNSKEDMEKHFNDIKKYHGPEAEARHRKQADERAKDRQAKAEHELPSHTLKHRVNSKGNIVDAGSHLRKVNSPNIKDTYSVRSGPNKGKQIKVPENSVEEYKKDK